MVNAGISVSNAVSFMENEACGPENLGFIRKDAYDHMSRLRKHTKVENGDATALIQYFIDKANKENYFYWNVQLDDDDRVMNFFFRDYRCSLDYEYFGDVLSIDTTYKTNKYNLICAPFVAFKKMWYKCMTYCESEDEFEATWRYMIDTYSLGGHKWLNGMYKIRQKWATAFSNGRFSAGILATSRSEVTNMVLKKSGNKMSSLYEFVINYSKIQKNWRVKEKTEDTRCRHGKPAQILKNHPLLIHAADVYTITIYQLFEIELINSLNCISVETPSCFGNDWNWIQIRVKSHDENSRVRTVLFNKQSHEIKCTCCKFETMGILCKHALMVFNSMHVTVLPNCYLLKRWMKNVKNRVNSSFQESDSVGGGHASEMVFVNQIMRSMYDLTQMSKSHDDARRKLHGMVETAKDEISNLVENLSVDDETACDHIPTDGHMHEVQKEQNGKIKVHKMPTTHRR
ncbi:protein FAR1-RELATED SEQUENCE 5-like [Primulina eburnea]|uniref:protein FAR1-RELATED SEQUENCE 5-like n=1 Tax=Primulina eburnea TaxID=1245227 RepID=UPI003C6BFBC1